MKRFITSAASFLLAVTAGVAVFAPPAQAATTGWPQTITDVGDSALRTTADGGVTVTNCSDGQVAIKSFSAAGATTATVPQRTDGMQTPSCRSVVGKDGTVFGVAEDYYSNFAVVAYKGTAKLWERSFTHYCTVDRFTYQRAINRVLVGTDGFLYVVSHAAYCYGSGDYLTKLNATSGQAVFDKQLHRPSTSFLTATSLGLVRQDVDRGIRYYRYDGTEFATPVTAAGRVQAVDMNARVFTTDAQMETCSTLKMYIPGATAPFSFTMPACWRIWGVAPTSQNGLAMLAYNQNGKPTLTSYTSKTGGGFNAASIVLPDTEGYRSFKALDQFGEYLEASIQTDMNGNILVVRPYEWKRGDYTLAGWQFTLHAANLNVVAEYDTSAFDFQQSTRFARMMGWSIAKDKLYISVGYCTNSDLGWCEGLSRTLYAVRMARLNMDYPRGAVLGVTPTTVTCKKVTFVGVRGSGEDSFAYEGLGETVQHVKDRLVAAGVTNMEVVAVAYPATPVNFLSTEYPPDYADSVAGGIDAVNATLIQINRDCPQTQIVLVTYSQGAHATDGVRYLPAAIQNQIKAMVLLGDPLFNPLLTTVNKGTFRAEYSGIWVDPLGPGDLPERQFSSVMTGRIASYCIADDPVCNFDAADAIVCHFNPQVCQHTQYKPNWTQQAATWTRGKITT